MQWRRLSHFGLLFNWELRAECRGSDPSVPLSLTSRDVPPPGTHSIATEKEGKWFLITWSLHQQQQIKETANPAEKKIFHVLLNAFLFWKPSLKFTKVLSPVSRSYTLGQIINRDVSLEIKYRNPVPKKLRLNTLYFYDSSFVADYCFWWLCLPATLWTAPQNPYCSKWCFSKMDFLHDFAFFGCLKSESVQL